MTKQRVKSSQCERASELNARLTDTRSAIGFHTRVFDAFPTQRMTKTRLNSLPAVKPVFTNIAFYHKPAHIVRLPADAVQLGRRHLRDCPQTTHAAKLPGTELSWAGIPLIMRKQHQEELRFTCEI